MNHLENILLGIFLYSAINSNNPLETIHQQVTDLRKAKTITMMLKDLAAFYGIDKASIKEIFKIKIQIKRNINLSYISDKMREKL